jgi:hypothetical protein
VKGRLIALSFLLASLPPAYACFVYGWQLVGFTGFAVRVGDDLPWQAWGQIALVAGQMIVIAAALLVVGQGVSGRGHRKAAIALGVAWVATAPLLILLMRPY